MQGVSAEGERAQGHREMACGLRACGQGQAFRMGPDVQAAGIGQRHGKRAAQRINRAQVGQGECQRRRTRRPWRQRGMHLQRGHGYDKGNGKVAARQVGDARAPLHSIGINGPRGRGEGHAALAHGVGREGDVQRARDHRLARGVVDGDRTADGLGQVQAVDDTDGDGDRFVAAVGRFGRHHLDAEVGEYRPDTTLG